MAYGRVAILGGERTEKHQVTDGGDKGWLQNTAALNFTEHGVKMRQPSTMLNGRSI